MYIYIKDGHDTYILLSLLLVSLTLTKNAYTCILISAVRTCPKLSTPQNGHINCSLSEISYKTVCLFTCNEGYELEGHTKLTCQGNSQWDGKEPKCVGMFQMLQCISLVPFIF